jgi:hypothetical protein
MRTKLSEGKTRSRRTLGNAPVALGALVDADVAAGETFDGVEVGDSSPPLLQAPLRSVTRRTGKTARRVSRVKATYPVSVSHS